MFTLLQLFCLRKSSQHPGRFTKTHLRRFDIDLYNLLACCISDICYLYCQRYIAIRLLKMSSSFLKIRIRKPEPKGKHYIFPRNGFKIPISDINIFLIIIANIIAKICCRRIILNTVCYRVCHSPRRIHISRKNIHHAKSSGHSSLPRIEQCLTWFETTVPHINNISNIKYDDHLVKL